MKISFVLFLVGSVFGPVLSQTLPSSDEFEDASTLSNWSNLTTVEGWTAEHYQTFDINGSTAGNMTIVPRTSSWYNDHRGGLLFKLATGDFVVTTELTVTNRASSGHPSSQFSLAGLMLRTPKTLTTGSAGWVAGQENYVFHALGYAADSHFTLPTIPTPAPHFEVKTTSNSSSTLAVSAAPSSTNMQLRIARLGDYIILLIRESGGSWQVHTRFARADFPSALQVGMVAYTDYWKVAAFGNVTFTNDTELGPGTTPDPNPGMAYNPDVRAAFEFMRFDAVTVPAPLVGQDLTSASVTDADLLGFLGYNSTSSFAADQKLGRTKLSVFPNPGLGKFRIENVNEGGLVQVWSMDGRLVLERQWEVGEELVMKDFSPGMYRLRLVGNDSATVYHSSIVIQ